MPQKDPDSSTDILGPVYRRINELQKQVDSLQNLSIPTVPTYDPDNFPQDSVDGQLAIGIDNVLRFYNGRWWDTWHQDALTAPWVWLGSPYFHPAYKMGLDGNLRFRGALTGGAANDPIWHLPLTHRPSNDQTYVVGIGTSAGLINVRASDGAVYPLA